MNKLTTNNARMKLILGGMPLCRIPMAIQSAVMIVIGMFTRFYSIESRAGNVKGIL